MAFCINKTSNKQKSIESELSNAINKINELDAQMKGKKNERG